MARSGEDRLKMGGEMFDAARALVQAGLLARAGPADEAEMRARLFMRLYGADVAPQTAERIATRLRGRLC